MKRSVGAVLLVCIFALPQPVAAHPAPFSYMDILVRPGSLEVALVAHIFDLADDLQIAPPERLLEPGVAASRAAALRSLLGARFDLQVDGTALKAEWSAPEVLADRQS